MKYDNICDWSLKTISLNHHIADFEKCQFEIFQQL